MREHQEVIDILLNEIKKQGRTAESALNSSGISNKTIDNMKKGSHPSYDKIAILCESLDISLDFLLLNKNNSDMSSDEEKLLSYYRSLSEDDRITALGDLIRFANSRRSD